MQHDAIWWFLMEADEGQSGYLHANTQPHKGAGAKQNSNGLWVVRAYARSISSTAHH